MPSVEECRRTMFHWAERMQRRAATLSNVVTCGHLFGPYSRRIEKVKFGVPVEEVCKNDIPGLLLVLILKLNKEGLYKKDIFRAPGHQGNIRKLASILQVGRLINMDRFSVYTIASVLKKFLSKIPGGIFGKEGEEELFRIIELDDLTEQRMCLRRLILSLPDPTQKLLVLIFGTLRLIASNCETYNTGMTSEALGVSIAPSFFQTCVSDGKEATMDDVLRFKVATQIMKFIIDNFGAFNIFGRDNYEYYSRITGRVLKVGSEWVFSVRYPPNQVLALFEDGEVLARSFNLSALSDQADARSCLTLVNILAARARASSSSLNAIPGQVLLESSARLSMSLEESEFFSSCFLKCTPKAAAAAAAADAERMTMELLGIVNRDVESTKSLSCLPEVHERQIERMRARSEWFLSPVVAPRQVTFAEDFGPASAFALRGSGLKDAAGLGAAGLSASAESIQKRPLIRKSNLRKVAQQPIKKDEDDAEKKAAEQAAKQAAEQAAKQAAKQAAEQAAKQAAEQAAKQAAEKAVKKGKAKPKKSKKVALAAED